MSPWITNGILASIRHRESKDVESKDVQPCIKPGYTEKLKRLLSKHVQEI